MANRYLHASSLVNRTSGTTSRSTVRYLSGCAARVLQVRRLYTASPGLGPAASSIPRTWWICRLTYPWCLPVVIEVVDTEEHMARLGPILDEMMSGGLVTLEKVRVLRYAPQLRSG